MECNGDSSDKNKENIFLTNLWQRRQLGHNVKSTRDRADLLRSLMGQMDDRSEPDRSMLYLINEKRNELLSEYSRIVDSKDMLNNYAKPTMALNKTKKNDSKDWKCGISAEQCLNFFQSSSDKAETRHSPELDLSEEYQKLSQLMKSQPTKTLTDYMEGRVNTTMTRESACSLRDSTGQDENMEKPLKVTSRSGGVAQAAFKTSVTSRQESKYPWQVKKMESAPGSPKCSVGEPSTASFRTASEQLMIEKVNKNNSSEQLVYGTGKKCLGTRKMVNSKFTPPVLRNEDQDCMQHSNSSDNSLTNISPELLNNKYLKNIDSKMVELILGEIMDTGSQISWNDIAGLELAKKTIQEIVVWPMLRPDIFTGLRGPPKAILLFGPPGTGKTMIGKCIASQSKSTFFSISASSLTSKWIGDGEKMVRAMFAVARCYQPAVIFVDEIDSLLSQRSDSEHESSRRIKTEFLIQLDGATSDGDERLLLIGATNRPHELDEAARRRLVKRLYIPLPEGNARGKIMQNLLASQSHSLSSNDIEDIVGQTDGYSGADMANLCREAALGPIRDITAEMMVDISLDEVRPISREDFFEALKCIRASVSSQDLDSYLEWNKRYGISGR